MTHTDRINKVRSLLSRFKLDALIVSDPSNIFYLTGLGIHDSALIITREKRYIVTDFRYKEEAERIAKGICVISKPGALHKKTARLIRESSFGRVGFEPAHLTVAAEHALKKSGRIKLLPVPGFFEKLRCRKYPDEIEAIRASAKIVKEVLKSIVKEVRINRTEKSIALKIDTLLKKQGADSMAFDTIVASGANASMPHAKPSTRKIKKGEPVILDFGARVNGYTSDLTRTIFVGKITKHFNIIYSIVKQAQKRAIAKVRPGVKISEVDSAARDYIASKGFGKYFGHATGHCLGIDVHESPGINSKNHTKLKTGMVFTIEPGIYIPGKGGVRIEDMVLVTNKGREVLT